jgi:hypothetical protein
VITLFALQYDVTEQNPIFAKLFDAAHFELAIIIKLTATLLAVGLILFSFIVSYNVKDAKKFNFIAHLCLFYAALFAMFMYFFIVASNISTLIAIFTAAYVQFIVLIILGYAIGSYYGTQLKAYLAEN